MALAGLGVTRLRLAVRAEPRPETLAVAEACELAVDVVPIEVWAQQPGRVVVSTLPPAASAGAAAGVEVAGARFDGVTLLDVVYADWPTPLAQAASAHGMAVVSGLDMLVHQAGEQFRLFTGAEPPLNAMLAAGRAALAA
jgi:shikimate dehydrogenase